jgi:hypothetical protein
VHRVGGMVQKLVQTFPKYLDVCRKGGDGAEAGAHIPKFLDVCRTEGDSAVHAPCGGDGSEAGALILQVWMCAGRGVMVQYVLPVEGMVQKLVLLFYKCGCVQDEG